MTRVRSFALVIAFVAAAGTAAAPGEPVDTPILSSNVKLVGNVPEIGAIGGHVREVETMLGRKRYFVMTSARGVSAYDVTVPEVPVLAGHLPLPHFENEDVDFGGNLLLVSSDPGWLDPTELTDPERLGGIYIVDTSKLPVMTLAYENVATGNRWTEPVRDWAGHTISCIRADCSFAVVLGTEVVVVADLTTPSNPRVVREFFSAVGRTHDAQMDAAGVVWISGARGVAGYDFTDPAKPRWIVTSWGGRGIQHNSWRPRADEWKPRTSDTWLDASVEPGELLLVTEENYLPRVQQTQCVDQGRFQTRRLRDVDAFTSGATPQIEVLDTWETPLQLGSRSPASVCSAHYFHERDGIVAIAWYQQGTRFLDVSDPRDIREVGYFINHGGLAFSVEWIGPGTAGGEIAYTIDAARGLDVLRFDRGATAASAPPIVSDIASVSTRAGMPHPLWGWGCRLPG